MTFAVSPFLCTTRRDAGAASRDPGDVLMLQISFPLALDSDDYKFPRGTTNDNTHGPQFVAACERIFDRKVRHLDLGCAGGGLVADFLSTGNFSIGLEGSDFSKINNRGEWKNIPGNLFTADITKPFMVADKFDVITAWEVLEHIRNRDLIGLFQNIQNNLSLSGIFVASVAMFEDKDPTLGAVWHQTVMPKSWWEDKFLSNGFVLIPSPFNHEEYVRGNGNPTVPDWDSQKDPSRGFHIVAKLRG